MAPFRGQPGVVEVEPADHGSDVERGLHRIELIASARNARTVGHDGAGNDRPQQLGAGGIFEGFEAAAQRVDQAGPRRRLSQIALDLVVQRVVGNVSENFVGRRTFVADVRRHTFSLGGRLQDAA